LINNESFDLESHLKDIYATFPEARRKPMIGITANYVDGDVTLRDRYYTQWWRRAACR
jgi:hypothetical protein